MFGHTEAQTMAPPAEMTGWEAGGPKVTESDRQPLALMWRAEKRSVQSGTLREPFLTNHQEGSMLPPPLPPQVYFREVEPERSH